MTPLASLPYLTANVPGIGGRIRETPEDFEVEEIPAYEPCGTGEHLFLWLEKRGLGAEFFLQRLAKRLGVSSRDIGSAGLKDRHAVTRQYISVPATAEGRLADIDGDGIRLLRQARHTNKLRSGHLRGNRFRITIRHADPNIDPEPILARIRQEGMPNFYGPQRFGHDGSTWKIGCELLTGKLCRMPPFCRRLALSAVQSDLFNRYLAQRLSDGLSRTALLGEAMARWPVGGPFRVEDVATEQRRLDQREIIPMGPIFGAKTFAVSGVAAEREAAVLAVSGFTQSNFENFGSLMAGTRRYNFVYVDDLTATRSERDGHVDWTLTFSLPAGSYATILLAEVMKSRIADITEEAD